MRHFVFHKISQLGIQYRKSQHPFTAGNFNTCAPHAGDRFPFLTYPETGVMIDLQENVKRGSYKLFVFDRQNGIGISSPVMEQYESILTAEYVTCQPSTLLLYRRLGIRENGCFLVRPDHHIAVRCNIHAMDLVEKYFQRYYV